MSEPTKVAVPVTELSELHARVGRLEGAARMASLILNGSPTGHEVREIANALAELAIGTQEPSA